MPVKDTYVFNQHECIPIFCFNGDMSRLALSPNTSEVLLYSFTNNQWKLETTLSEHTERVTGIDWSKQSNKLLTCAADRNAYVWSEDKPNDWKQSLVLLRIDRAAINCKWDPSEKKFAVGTGSKLICICYYEEANDWWVSKHIKKPIRSSVTCIDWHPSSTILAAGSTDFHLRVYAAAVKGVDSKPPVTGWGDKLAFGTLLAEFKSSDNGWVHSTSFSPSGNRLVWVSHDCTISVADVTNGPVIHVIHKIEFLPFLSCIFVDESNIIAAGHNNSPYKFTWDGTKLATVGDVDTKDSSKSQAASTEQSAMSKFRNMDKLAQTSAVESAAAKKTHANSITHISRLPNNLLASSGLDSKIAIWEKC